MDLFVNPSRTMKYEACPKCGGPNSAECGGNTGCFHCGNCHWVECVDAVVDIGFPQDPEDNRFPQDPEDNK